MSEKAPTTNQEIADLVTVDEAGKGHRPDGKFLSNHHMEMIAAHQDQIRDGLDEYQAADKELAEKQVKYSEGDTVYVKSMSRKKDVRGSVKEFKVASIYENKDGDREVKLLSTDGEEDQRILYSALQTNVQAPPAATEDKRPGEVGGVIAAPRSNGTYANKSQELFNGGKEDLGLRPVEDGEYGDDYLAREDNSNPDDEDYLPTGVMAHEPWTIADSPDNRTTEAPANPGQPVGNGSGEFPNEYGYAGPVEPGSEIELAGPTDIEPYNPGSSEIEPYNPDVISPELEGMLAHLETNRDEYARMRGNRSGKVFSKKFSKENLEAAAEAWVKSHKKAGAEIAKLFIEAGASEEEIAQLAAAGAVDESLRLSELTRRFSLEATGRVEVDEDGSVTEKDAGFIKQRVNKFYDWWARQHGVKGTIKKAAAGAALGLVPGIAFGGALGVAGGGILAGAVGTRLAKGLLTGKINKNAHAQRVADTNYERDQADLDAMIAQNDGAAAVTSEMIAETLNAATRKDVVKNRKRQAIVGGMAIGGAVVGNVAHEWLSDRLSGNGPKVTPDEAPEPKAPVPVEEPAPEIPIDEGPVAEVLPDPVDTSAFRYPWNWAEHEFGAASATPKLYELADKAQAAGHNVEWHGSGVNEWIEIDGNSETDFVINTLNQYR